VRLAQRIPVRVKIDDVPEGVRLVAGQTATVSVDPKPVQAAKQDTTPGTTPAATQSPSQRAAPDTPPPA
jgi:multidrug resistance efflux pump